MTSSSIPAQILQYFYIFFNIDYFQFISFLPFPIMLNLMSHLSCTSCQITKYEQYPSCLKKMPPIMAKRSSLFQRARVNAEAPKAHASVKHTVVLWAEGSQAFPRQHLNYIMGRLRMWSDFLELQMLILLLRISVIILLVLWHLRLMNAHKHRGVLNQRSCFPGHISDRERDTKQNELSALWRKHA